MERDERLGFDGLYSGTKFSIAEFIEDYAKGKIRLEPTERIGFTNYCPKRPDSALQTRLFSLQFGPLCRTSISRKLLRERSERFRSCDKSRRNAACGRGSATLLMILTASSLSSTLAGFDSGLIVASNTLERKDIVEVLVI